MAALINYQKKKKYQFQVDLVWSVFHHENNSHQFTSHFLIMKGISGCNSIVTEKYLKHQIHNFLFTTMPQRSLSILEKIKEKGLYTSSSGREKESLPLSFREGGADIQGEEG
jgi:hypothetical protein